MSEPTVQQLQQKLIADFEAFKLSEEADDHELFAQKRQEFMKALASIGQPAQQLVTYNRSVAEMMR